MEGTYTGFLQNIIGEKGWKNSDRTWVTPAAAVVMEAEGMKSAATYIEQRNGTVAQWGVLRLMFEVCTRDKGYKGWGALEDTMVAPGVPRSNTQGNLVVEDLAGGKGKAGQEGKPVGNGIGSGELGVDVRTYGDVGTEMGNSQVGGVTLGGDGIRRNRL